MLPLYPTIAVLQDTILDSEMSMLRKVPLNIMSTFVPESMNTWSTSQLPIFSVRTSASTWGGGSPRTLSCHWRKRILSARGGRMTG